MQLLPVGLPGKPVLGTVDVAQKQNKNEAISKVSFFPNTFVPYRSPIKLSS